MGADTATVGNSFEGALDIHWRRIFNFAFRMTMSRDEASDITHETFLRAYVGLDDESAARSLGIKTSAYKVRLSRARKKVEDYLAPRCEHVNPNNPCHCPSRLGVALGRGFIAAPPSAEASLRKRSRSLAFAD